MPAANAVASQRAGSSSRGRLACSRCGGNLYLDEDRCLVCLACGRPLGSRRGAPWTPAEDAILLAATRRRWPLAQIAATLGRTPDAVSGRRRALGIQRPRPRWRAEEAARLRELLASGLTQAAAARVLGRTPQSVRDYVRAHRNAQKTPSWRRWTGPEYRVALMALEGRRSYAEVARQLGRTPDAVRVALYRLRVGRLRHEPRED